MSSVQRIKQHHLHRSKVGFLAYVVGFLSFVPLVGVPLGIIAIVWGVKARQNGGGKLIGLGVAGILVTVGLYSYLFVELNRFIQSGDAEAIQNFPFEIMLQSSDLPKGWYRVKIYDSIEPKPANAQISVARFEIDPNDSVLNIQQQLAVFQSVDQAHKAYSDWGNHWIPTQEWALLPQAAFKPQDSQDEMRFECINLNRISSGLPLSTCTVVQHHQNLVSLVLINIDYRAITLEQFEQALTQIDTRMNQWKPPPTTP